MGFAKWRLTCFYDSLVQGSTVVLLMNFSANIPPLRKAPKTMSQALAELSSMSYLRQRDGRISNY